MLTLQLDHSLFYDDGVDGTQSEWEEQPILSDNLSTELASKWNKRSKSAEGIYDLVEREGLFTKKELDIQNAPIKIYDDSLTEEEREAEIKRLREQRLKFALLKKRDRRHKVSHVRTFHSHVTNEEVIVAFDTNSNCDEEEIVSKLFKYQFLHHLRRQVALIYNPNPTGKLDHVKMWDEDVDASEEQIEEPEPIEEQEDEEEEQRKKKKRRHASDDEDDEDFKVEKKKKRKIDYKAPEPIKVEPPPKVEKKVEPRPEPVRVQPKRGKEEKPPTYVPVITYVSRKVEKKPNYVEEKSEDEDDEEEEEDDYNISEQESDSEDDDDEDFKPSKQYKKTTPKKAKKTKTPKQPTQRTIKKDGTERKRREGRLTLDNALTSDKADWSEARIMAYSKIDTNPNSYYYRFNKPGEAQKNGNWSKEEREMFFERLKQFDCRNDPKWGIFAMAIPGRVGYQCANFYRAMVASGDIKDEKYAFDENGKMFCKEGKRARKHLVEGVAVPINDQTKRKRRMKNGEEDLEDDFDSSDDDAIDSDDEATLQLLKKSTLRQYQNPLAGFKDSITNEEVVNPYISPYGHVLSHKTWLKVLIENDSQGKCPFTKQPLTMQNLIKLTFENIDKYRPTIKNVDTEV